MRYTGSLFTILGISALASVAYATTPSSNTELIAAVKQSPDFSRFLSYDLGKIFTYFMVMLGPIKLVGPFAKFTMHLEPKEMNAIALKSTTIAFVGGVIAAYLGQSILVSWGISLPALVLAAGTVLLLVALKNVLTQYQKPVAPALHGELKPFSIAFPHIMAPYGTAAFILLLAAAPTVNQDLQIFLIFLAVMALNLLVMIFARPILKYMGWFLAILGSILGVLQVALAVEMFLMAGKMLNIMP